jgi:sugar lactone lactonase YvrE
MSRALFLGINLLFASYAFGDELFTFEQYVGRPSSRGWYDGNAGQARFSEPQDVAVGDDGSIYVADTLNRTIRRVSPSGAVSTLAGKEGEIGARDGAGAEASFTLPTAAAIDRNGNLFVTDLCAIRKVTFDGVVTTIAGSVLTCGVRDGLSDEARFDHPLGLTVGNDGTIYVSDSGNHTVRRIGSSGQVTTLAGRAGFPGSADGAGEVAQFRYPHGIVVSSDGAIYVADQQNVTIRRIAPNGVVSTFAGEPRTPGMLDAPGRAARFEQPLGLALGGDGNVYVTDNGSIRRVSSAGVVTTITGMARWAGSRDGLFHEAMFNHPRGIAADAAGNLYVADTSNNTIRKVETRGVVTTLAGLAPDAVPGDERLWAEDIAFGADGNVYVAAYRCVLKVSPAGAVSVLAGNCDEGGDKDGVASAARFTQASAIASDDQGAIYVADAARATIKRIVDGVVVTVAGRSGIRGVADGPATSAFFESPMGLAFDREGNLYIADTGNNKIRKLSTDGMVSTVAGVRRDFAIGGYVDGPANAAEFYFPVDVEVDALGNLYVADLANRVIRKIDRNGIVSTVAGSPGRSEGVDGVGKEARFGGPSSLSIGPDGDIYVSDSANCTIRKVTPSGAVSTIGGKSGSCSDVLGTGPTARFSRPQAIAADDAGTLHVLDEYSIRTGVTTSQAVHAAAQPLRACIGSIVRLRQHPETAANSEWRVARRPGGSLVEVASSGDELTLIPDRLGLYTFLLRSEGVTGVRYSTTDVEVRCLSPRPRPVR